MIPAAARALLILAALTAFLPFLAKPLFIDDHAVFAQARDLAKRPEIPYAMESHKLGWTPGQSVGEDNPPLFFYGLASVIRFAGAEPWKSRLAMVPLQVIGLLAFFFLARQFLRYPLWASLLLLVSPHMWVTSNSLLVDSVLGPVMWMGLVAWMKAIEKSSAGWAFTAAIFLAAAPLIKYTGFLIWPVALLWPFLQNRRPAPRLWLWWLFPIALFLAWLLFTRAVYGADHFSAVARSRMVWPEWEKAVTLSAFCAATMPCVFLAFFAGATARSAARPWVWGAAFGAMTAALFSGHGLWVCLALGGWAAVFAGAFVTFIASLSTPEDSAFLFFWMIAGLLGLSAALDWVCVRFLVILGAPVTLLSIQALERLKPRWVQSIGFRGITLACAAGFGLLVMHADRVQSGVDAEAAKWAMEWKAAHAPQAPAGYAGATLGALGEYLPAESWRAFTAQDTPIPGTLLLIPRHGLPPRFLPIVASAEPLDSKEFRTWNPVRVLDRYSGAGFYGSIWGPLPLGFTRAPIEIYSLVRVLP